MPKYLFLIQVAEDASPAPGEGDPTAWLEQTGGRRLIGGPTESWSAARTVRVRDGKRLVTDGPFAETKDAIAGFDVIECDSLEEAVGIAADHPVSRFGGVEIRPLVD